MTVVTSFKGNLLGSGGKATPVFSPLPSHGYCMNTQILKKGTRCGLPQVIEKDRVALSIFEGLHPLFLNICLFLTVLGLPCFVLAFSVCGQQGELLSCSVRASHCGGFSCCRAQFIGNVGFSSCCMWAQ